jgi:endonuclease III
MTGRTVPKTRLARLVQRLRRFHGPPTAPPVRDPYRLLLWEQVGYLADDDSRLAAYRLLEETVGTEPASVLGAPTTTLRAVARRGGSIGVAARAERLRAVAQRVLRDWEGSFDAVLRLPLRDARRELKRHPAIGEAGAERILLLSGAHPILALDSNAVRVLLRLGYGQEDARWDRCYRSAQAAAQDELRETVSVRRGAYLLLRHHGKTLCRRNAPRCHECPLRDDCPVGRERGA